MARKHVVEYFKDIEKLYFDMVHSLEEMESEFNKGNVTEEELNKLLMPVNNIKDNYLRLAYVMHLLNMPVRNQKKSKYQRQEKKSVDFFDKMSLTKEQTLIESQEALKKFKENLASLKEGK